MATDDFFRARLDHMIDMRHPLAVLTTRLPWAQIEPWLAPLFVHRRARVVRWVMRICSARLLSRSALASATPAGRVCRSA